MSADVSILACSPSIFTLREIDSQKRVQCYHGGTSTSRSQHEPISRGRCIKQGGDGIRQVLGSFSTKWKQNLNDFFDQVTSAKKMNGLESECIADVFFSSSSSHCPKATNTVHFPTEPRGGGDARTKTVLCERCCCGADQTTAGSQAVQPTPASVTVASKLVGTNFICRTMTKRWHN